MEIGPDGKPCRACSDFKSWMKMGGTGKEQTNKAVSAKKVEEKKPCPPDVNEIGRGTWTLLHTMSVYLPENDLSQQQKSDATQFMNILARNYPCSHCADDLKEDLKIIPPQVKTGQDFANWMCRLHNKVNTKLGKKEFDCSQVYQRWRDGYPDRSCD